MMVGHATVRRKVMGEDFRRPAKAEEMKPWPNWWSKLCSKAPSGYPPGWSMKSEATGTTPRK